jgi:hypothetical protein
MMKQRTDAQSTTGVPGLDDSGTLEAGAALHSEAIMNRSRWHRPQLQRLRVSVDTAASGGSGGDAGGQATNC